MNILIHIKQLLLEQNMYKNRKATDLNWERRGSQKRFSLANGSWAEWDLKGELDIPYTVCTGGRASFQVRNAKCKALEKCVEGGKRTETRLVWLGLREHEKSDRGYTWKGVQNLWDRELVQKLGVYPLKGLKRRRRCNQFCVLKRLLCMFPVLVS